MARDFSLAIVKWDQKAGGILQYAFPKITISNNTAMNLYNMHRMTETNPNFGTLRLKLENGERYNVATFFTGYGASTSPDGFTANYGKNTIGVAERVFCLFLPTDVKPELYDEALIKITSRVVLDPDIMHRKIDKIAGMIKKGEMIKDPVKLYGYLEKYLDRTLGLSAQQEAVAWSHEVKALHYLIQDKKEHIHELTINPAKSAYVCDQQRLADAEEQKKEIQDLLKQITSLSAEKEMIESIDDQKDMVIEQLKEDYKKIFGTLTGQIQLLENEINGITESTQGLVNDLNTALADKINTIQELKNQLEDLKSASA